jgi:hypothetical protein
VRGARRVAERRVPHGHALRRSLLHALLDARDEVLEVERVAARLERDLQLFLELSRLLAGCDHDHRHGDDRRPGDLALHRGLGEPALEERAIDSEEGARPRAIARAEHLERGRHRPAAVPRDLEPREDARVLRRLDERAPHERGAVRDHRVLGHVARLVVVVGTRLLPAPEVLEGCGVDRHDALRGRARLLEGLVAAKPVLVLDAPVAERREPDGRPREEQAEGEDRVPHGASPPQR